MDSITKLVGYKIAEQLYVGSRTLVYRAVRECDRTPVVIKMLRNNFPTYNELVQFRNQYAIAKNLNLPSIIKPLALEPYEQSYILVMEDFGGISLKQILKQNGKLGVSVFFPIAIQIAEALDGLYQHRVIHKDLKPANILINPETQQIKIIDFSIASLLPHETQEIQNLKALEGTLAYLSPEQTGRMNRGIDYRSDFYSLGVTFYELLTGKLPFVSENPIELVHCHLAKQPIPVHQINPEIPEVLSALISKLMAKNAEDRYQSALGLKFDLENCWLQWQDNGTVTPFALGTRDICDRFLIPQKLYGREKEVATILNAFERVSAGDTEIILVAGFSGIGKTAVINEVHKPIVRQQGYFIKGKYDQFQRNSPFSAFLQAFRDLIGQLLSESDRQLQQWKTKILAAVGENGQVLIEVIPELEHIIGKQPLAAELAGSEAQNRFNLLFQNFVQVFTTAEHPLVVFLDDLQWIDSASLNLLQLLMQERRHLLVIGAYRDNEVSPAHPLMLTVDSIQKTGAIVNAITLLPLSHCAVNQLIADTLNCQVTAVESLIEWVDRKTKGNPFFITQFLKALHEEGHITFNWEAQHWQFDITQVRVSALSDDVVEFMALQLQKLPLIAQTVLKLAACIGNQFDLQTLAIVSEMSVLETATNLWQVLKEGLIIPTSDVYKFDREPEFRIQNSPEQINPPNSCSYKFLHDRVQQAAYSLIPDEEKQSTHLKIGKILLENTPEAVWEEKIFAIVNQLNIGRSLIISQSERNQLIQLNLTAARKAKSATAYGAAIEYLTTGIELLPEDSWQSQYYLTLTLYEAAAEAAYLNTNYLQMEQLAAVILHRTDNLLEKIRVYEIKMLAAKAQSRLLESVQIGLQVLQLLGVEFPEQPTFADIGQALEQTLLAWQNLSIPNLLNAPTITDPAKLAVMRILTQMVPSAYQAASTLMPLLIFQQINLSIADGNCAVCAFSYADYGLVLCGVVGDMDAGYQFGQLALNILDRFQAIACKCRTYFIVHSFISHWQEPLQSLLPRFQEAYKVGLETGDLESSALNAQMYCTNAYYAGHELATLASKMATYRQAIYQLKQEVTLHFLGICQQTVLNLLGRAQNACQLVGDVYDETQLLPLHQQTNNYTALYYLYINKSILCYLFRQYQAAADYVALADRYVNGVVGMFAVTLLEFYSSLIYLALYSSATPTERSNYLEKVVANQEKLKKWSDRAPMNHLHKYYLVEAERHRVLGDKAAAIEFYDRAITLAQEHEYIQEAALANELAAKFYLEWGKEKIAQSYTIDAYYAYTRWGATAKVNDLEQHYPQLLAPIWQPWQPAFSSHDTTIPDTLITFSHPHKSTSGGNTAAARLDLATILKAYQTVASEIELEKLLYTLLQVLIENAGADKCVLLLPKDNEWVIEAISELGQLPSLPHSVPIHQTQAVALTLVNTVKHTLQSVVIANAIDHPIFAVDPYILHQCPKSALCTPILNQGKLIGILYLENHLTAGAFTGDRVELLNLLCSQAAIALENAKLYQNLQQSETQLRQQTQELQETLQQQQRIQAILTAQLEVNLDGILLVDENQKIVFYNKLFAKIFQMPEELLKTGEDNQLLGWAIEQIENPIEFLEKVQYLYQNPEQDSNDEVVLKDRRILDRWSTSVRSPSGEYYGRIWYFRDITERKQAEAQLRKHSQDLQQAFQDLQQAQTQLVQSEKMSALGNLVAGIAHEINNPVGFLSGNIQPALDYIQDVFGLIDLYQQEYLHPSAKIQKQIEAIDLDYIREDLPKVVASMREGVNRICDISTSLRTFSRSDSDRPVAYNIHDGINSTILILKHRLKANNIRPEIKIIKEYGQLPPVECYAGQLNQVFMNILANAIDALEDANKGRSFADIQANPNQIRITTATTADGQQVVIRIQDNGTGMSDEVKQKIFDHLFTTKGVGKGTGLGLAIARSIVVEKHNGTLEVNSILGEGSEFAITIPLEASIS
ncbi:trifunctional serine/threonine-protein kinase/ATP-binding protein/sensor histidine kinase [Calothrix sp. NIES-2098]|uniref:trifunctional serine/threonine-protein kinase/ATP-binding protein/sensor histidine kinase n=1 Tax=Calothrix sp. NIES-2098 TaxID=1954171 RepID=UPI000B605FED|nr:multi-sensor signal transduction multi-kinase [Calothrix sp. NIES-2098]